MNAKEIINSVGKGINAAFQTNQKFLGESIFDKNTNIKPEYISTVKIAEQLIGHDRIVKLETQMREIGRQVARDEYWSPLPKTKEGTNSFKKLKLMFKKQSQRLADNWNRIYDDKYGFIHKSLKRIDITVASNQDSKHTAPFLLIEVKLGESNTCRFKEDLNRLVKLIAMYNDAGILSERNIYGVLAFEIMEEDCITEDLIRHEESLNKLDLHLKELAQSHDWLEYKIGLIEQHTISEYATGYEAEDGNGNTYLEQAKLGFEFFPAMVLIGNAPDIKDAPLKL